MTEVTYKALAGASLREADGHGMLKLLQELREKNVRIDGVSNLCVCVCVRAHGRSGDTLQMTLQPLFRAI
jgi:hypothetical protein